MEQEGGGRGGGEGGNMNKQPQDNRRVVKDMQQGEGQVQVQIQAPQQPQKCPRCDSLNTKFCYYNNYSLSQPRYFCKTCRRYWTQGGTLRNVPVGGGCRKGKRAKNSSPSVENSSRSIPPSQEMVQNQPPPLTTMVRTKDPSSIVASPSITPFYQGVGVGGAGYLSSLAAIHSLNPSSHPFDQSLNVGGDAVRSSNLGLLSGFNAASLGSQRPIRPQQLFQMGSGEREVASLYSAEQGLINPPPSSMANNSAVSQHDWSQSFINNASNRASDASLWSTISTTSIGGNSERTSAGAGSSSLVPNQWPNLPGYGPPP